MNDAFKKFDLTGKTALVTGGATGVGYYMTRGLMRSGAKVIIAARREAVLESAAQKLRSESSSGDVICHVVDLNDRESINRLADYAIETLGGVDIFIGNAGQDPFELVDNLTNSVIDQALQVNLSSNMELVRAFIPGMRKKKWGRIMFSSSATSVCSMAEEGTSVYAATKSALNSFARTVAAEAGHDGITANSLVLGVFITDLIEDFIAKHGEEAAKGFMGSMAGMTSLGRWARADEVEGLIQFIASDAASYLTGTNLVYDGGLTTMIRSNTPPDVPIYPQSN